MRRVVVCALSLSLAVGTAAPLAAGTLRGQVEMLQTKGRKARDLSDVVVWVEGPQVAPPPAADGTIRVVEIVGLDRQACGGSHLTSTARSRPLRILKIDNKGRHNRRIRIGLPDAGPR